MVKKVDYQSEYRDRTFYLKLFLIILILIFIGTFGSLMNENLKKTSPDLPLFQRLFPVEGFYYTSSSQDISDVPNEFSGPLFADFTRPDLQGGLSQPAAESNLLSRILNFFSLNGLINQGGLDQANQIESGQPGGLTNQNQTSPRGGLPPTDPRLLELLNQEKLNSDLLASGNEPSEVINEFFYNPNNEIFVNYNLKNSSAIAKVIDFRWVEISEWTSYPDCAVLDSNGVPYKFSTINVVCKSNGIIRATTNSNDKAQFDIYWNSDK